MHKKLTLKYGKSIEINLNGEIKAHFPALLELIGKNVISIDFLPSVTNFSGAAAPESFYNLFLNLTENGQRYFTLDYPLNRINIDNTRGLKLDINRKLNFNDCYILNPDLLTGSVTLVIWWSEEKIPTKEDTLSVFDNIELTLRHGDGFNNLFPDYKTFVGYSVKNILAPSPLAIAPSGANIVSNTIINAAYLTLQRGTKIIFDQVPLVAILQNYAMYENLTFDNLMFDFNNSYIQVANGVDVSADLLNKIVLTLEFQDE